MRFACCHAPQGVIRAHANPMRLSFKMDVSSLMREHTCQQALGRPSVASGAGPSKMTAGLSLASPGTPGSAGPATPMAPAQRSGSGAGAGGAGRQASWGEEGQQEGPVFATRLPSCDLQGHCG